jgi:uncharacterized membrane protein
MMSTTRRDWLEDPPYWFTLMVGAIFGVGLIEVLILAVKVAAVAVALLSDAGNAWLREVLR